MKHFYLVSVSLFLLFAVSAVVASEASAVEFLLALWLAGGTAVNAPLLYSETWEVLLDSLNAGGLGFKAHIICESTVFDGFLDENSLFIASEMLDLMGKPIPISPLTGSALLCTNVENCSEPEVWAAGLVWEGEAFLMVDGSETFFTKLLTNAGYYVQCLVLGATVSEKCEGESNQKLTNEVNGTIDVEVSDAFQALSGLKLASCSLGGSETGEVEGLGNLEVSGVSLSVSE